jgi:hypothetical protein
MEEKNSPSNNFGDRGMDAKLLKEYKLVVKNHRVLATNIPKTNEEKKLASIRGSVTLDCGEVINCDDFISTDIKKKDDGYRHKIHPDHFASNKSISDELGINRCTYLCLSNPIRYAELALNELLNDQQQALDFMTEVLDSVIEKEASERGITWGEDSELKVISSAHLGKALAQCTMVEEAKPI